MIDLGDAYDVSNLDFYRQHHGQQLNYRWEGTVWWRQSPESALETIFAIASRPNPRSQICFVNAVSMAPLYINVL